MIAISTNRSEYRNDIAEEIRLFLGLAEIVLLEEIDPVAAELVFDLQLVQDGLHYTAFAKANDFECKEEFDLSENASILLKKKQQMVEAKVDKAKDIKILKTQSNNVWNF